MNTAPTPPSYKRHRFPGALIRHGVWVYFRCRLSSCDVEALLMERGIPVSYEAVRYGCRTCGPVYANQLRRRRTRPGDKWHVDAACLTINTQRHSLWRAGDQEGHVRDILVQRRRDKHAAQPCFRPLRPGCQYVPRVLVTDKRKSSGAAKREILPGVEHRPHRYRNNRAENSHQPPRQRERRRQRFTSPGHAQRCLAA